MPAYARARQVAAAVVATVLVAVAIPASPAQAAPYRSFAGEAVPANLRAATGETWFDPKDVGNCARQVNLPWCVVEASKGQRSLTATSDAKAVTASYQQRGQTWTAAQETALIAWAEKTARAGWRTPPEMKFDQDAEHWESFADQALAGKKWVGDCDNLTFTVLDLMSRQGFPIERMWRLQALTSMRGILHMVGGVQLSDGRFIIVGDAMEKTFYPMPEDRKWISANPVADGIVFHDFDGAAAFWSDFEAYERELRAKSKT